MFFRNYFISVADILEAKLKSHEREKLNSADKGELCEAFIKDFLVDSLGHLFKIFRGGNIVNSKGGLSKQIDVVVCRQKTIKIFSDKGIYPIETVVGAISITSNLDLAKLRESCEGLLSIPKKGYRFHMHDYLPEQFKKQTLQIFQIATPMTCIFGFRGTISKSWLKTLNEISKAIDPELISLLPAIIAVNKKGMIYRRIEKNNEKILVNYHYMDLRKVGFSGECFGRIVNELFNLSHEENNLQFDYTDYFNSDLGLH